MLARQLDQLDNDRAWLDNRRQHLSDARRALDEAFDKLAHA